jgi:hypothetical protein
MADRNYDDECGDHGGDEGNCGLPAGWGTDFDSGKCRHHRGTSPDGSSHESNDWAAKTGAYAEDFFEGFLTESEQQRVQEAREILGDKAGTQELGRMVASMALEQFRRTGDERFLRRFESICDKFEIAPDDVQRHELTGEGGGPVEVASPVVEITEDDI